MTFFIEHFGLQSGLKIFILSFLSNCKVFFKNFDVCLSENLQKPQTTKLKIDRHCNLLRLFVLSERWMKGEKY